MRMIPMSKKKNEADQLYNALNSYHQNIRLTLELDPTKFHDTQIVTEKLQLKRVIK